MALHSDEPPGRESQLRRLIADLEDRLTSARAELRLLAEAPTTSGATADVSARSSAGAKVDLFRSLFAGRTDAYAVRWTSKRTGKSGWSPAVRGGFYSESTTDHDLLPLTDDVVATHLTGRDRAGREFHAGLYVMGEDDSCRLLACDFDDNDWRADVSAYAAAAGSLGLEVAVEVSRSGSGAHAWLFFGEALPAVEARLLGARILKGAMSASPGIRMSSYDRLFPAQDLLPRRAPGRLRLGNLIALPLQGTCRRNGTTVFVDPSTWEVLPDQFAFLSSVKRIERDHLRTLLSDDHLVERVRAAPREFAARLAMPRTLEMRLGAQLAIRTAGLPGPLVSDLRHLASVQNPEFYRRQAARFSTYGVPRLVQCFEEDPDEIRLPRGLTEQAHGLIASAGCAVSVEPNFERPRSITATFVGELRPEQAAAVAVMRGHETGVLVAPAGSGKTVLACALIADRGVSTAIIVNRAELLDQWRQRLGEFLGISEKRIGQLGNGRRNLKGEIDLVMLQSLTHREADPTVLDGYGQVIVDECHAVAAPSTEAALRRIRVQRWVGLTATPYRADEMNDLITMQCGPVRHTIGQRPAGARRLLVHSTQFQTDEPGTDGPSIQSIYTAAAGDEWRNAGIVEDVADGYRAGRHSLVLTNRVDHVETLARLLAPTTPNVHVLHGRLQKATRKEVRLRLEQHDESPFVLIAIDKVAGEGLDLPLLDTLFLTMPVSFKGRLVQQVGRITRASREDERPAEVHDYLDHLVPVFARMHRKRVRLLAKEGFTVSQQRADPPPAEDPAQGALLERRSIS